MQVLAVGSSKIIVLAKKSDALREELGIGENVAKQIVAVAMSEAGSACMVAMYFSDSEDARRRVVDELIEKLRELGEEDNKPIIITI